MIIVKGSWADLSKIIVLVFLVETSLEIVLIARTFNLASRLVHLNLLSILLLRYIFFVTKTIVEGPGGALTWR